MMELSWWWHIVVVLVTAAGAGAVRLSLIECGAAAALGIDAAHALFAINQIVLHMPLGGATPSNNPQHTGHKQITGDNNHAE